MALELYNTLTRKKEVFKPIKKGNVGMYTCGPTVYSYQHIGNMRAYIFADVLKRVLLFNDLKVKHIINVTDVGHLTSDSDEGEDKIEKAAEKEGKKASAISKFYFKVFEEDIDKLNILKPLKWVWATKHIKEQIALVRKLEKKGFTYRTSDGIYFDSSKIKNYGKLANLKVKGLKAGKRVRVGDKKNRTDFALWKFSESAERGKRQQEWNSPWGKGFPGWHLECSAMSMKYLGERFDIHTGGEDHIPVHHTNEIAQSECATGKSPFVKYWLHGGFLTFHGEKISKSTGGLFTISDLEERGFDAEHYRYLCLQTTYRKPLEFSFESLEGAKNAYEKIKRKIVELRSESHKGNDLTEKYEKEFLEVVNDDLNMSKALKVFWSALEDFDFSPKKKLKLLEKFDKIFGLGVKRMEEEKVRVPKEVRALVREREDYRKEKAWEKADVLRKMIEEKGFILEDTQQGAKLRKA